MGRHTILSLLNVDFTADPDPDPAFLSNANPNPASKNNADPYLKPCLQCCGSGMFIPDPNFFHPGSDPIQDPGSASKNLSILTKKMVSTLSSEIWVPGSGS
jgi:hypothetical protein